MSERENPAWEIARHEATSIVEDFRQIPRQGYKERAIDFRKNKKGTKAVIHIVLTKELNSGQRNWTA